MNSFSTRLGAAIFLSLTAAACGSSPEPTASSDDALGEGAKKPAFVISPSNVQLSPGRAVKLTVSAKNLAKGDTMTIDATDVAADVWFEPGANSFVSAGRPVDVYLIARPSAKHGQHTVKLSGYTFDSGELKASLTYAVVGGDVGLTGPEAPSNISACHSVCETGTPIDDTCGACSTKVTTADAYCKLSYWDDVCVSEVFSLCGTCKAH